MPNPPAALTADVRRAPAITSMGADRIGCWMPRRAVNGVEIGMSIPCKMERQTKPNYHSPKMNTIEFYHLWKETELAMELSDLVTFQAVARLGGITRAANELNTVQSNVTQRVKALEA